MPSVLSRLLPVAASAYGLQAALALVFVPQANEKWYDCGGAMGFLSTTLVALCYPALRSNLASKSTTIIWPKVTDFAPRQLLGSALLAMWSVRLGTFLVNRALKAGGDSRFDEVKHQPLKFTAFWMAQATWVFLVGMPVYLLNVLPAAAHPPLGIRDWLAVGLFAASWTIEIVADHQKAVWRRAKNSKEHDEKFITGGLWAMSRHPNYLGEVGVWTGIWALSTSALSTPYAPRFTWVLAGVSPLVTWFLLTKVSGIPPLERAGDKKYAGPEWDNYKRNVPVFWPWGSH